MKLHNVGLIFRRELMDQLRDRRTLFMVAVLPLLLYPALGAGMMQMTVLFSEQPRTVVLLNAKDLPGPQLLDGERFAKAWFDEHRALQDKLHVLTDETPLPPNATDAQKKRRESTLEAAEKLRVLGRQLQELRQHEAVTTTAVTAPPTPLTGIPEPVTPTLPNGEGPPTLPITTVTKEGGPTPLADLEPAPSETEKSLLREMSKIFRDSGIQVLILVPDNFKASIADVDQKLTTRKLEGPGGRMAINLDYARPAIIYNKADDKSVIAYQRVIEVMNHWERAILQRQLLDGGLPEHLPRPINARPLDIADEQQFSNSIWSKLFPAMLIIMSVTGAFYPAIDLAAGEKERGTMETLLICPASRTDIVLGKFLTTLTFSLSTALLNLISLGMTGKYIASLSGGVTRNLDLTLPSLTALAWVFILLLPLAALFSALCLALATFAKSSKEGQYYLTPLLMVTMGLTVFCLSPAVEMQPFFSIMPVVGPALLLKEMLLNTHSGFTLWAYAAAVLVTSAGYSMLALWWAIDQFNREDVLFRESERFELGAWLRSLLRDKEPTPTFSMAGACFVLMLLLQFLALKMFQGQIDFGPATDEATRGVRMMQMLIIQQLTIIGTPALLMGIMLTTSVRQTFQFYLPHIKYVVAAVVLAFTLMPLAMTLQNAVAPFFPPLPDGIKVAMGMMSTDKVPSWLVLLAMAVAPAVCEELAFRGFILSGFRKGGRHGLAIVLSSICFGVIHMIPLQVFNAALLGLVIGLLAVRSRSILPGMIYHFLNNGTFVYLQTLKDEEPAWMKPLMVLNSSGEFHFASWFLGLCGVIAFSLLIWLIPKKFPSVTKAEDPGNEALPATA